MLLNILQSIGQSPTKKNYPAPNVSSAKAEKQLNLIFHFTRKYVQTLRSQDLLPKATEIFICTKLQRCIVIVMVTDSFLTGSLAQSPVLAT